MANKLIRVFDNIGFNFIIENNSFRPSGSIKTYNSLTADHVGYLIPYIARNINNRSFESGVGEIVFDNSGNIIVKRLNIITSSNNNSAVNFPSSGNDFYIFANQSSFDKGINNTIIVDDDSQLDPVGALYLVDCSEKHIVLRLPSTSVSKNLILEFKIINHANSLTIKSNTGSVVSVLNHSNNYARIACSDSDWVVLNEIDNKATPQIQSLALDGDSSFNILSSPSGSEYSLQYKLGTDFAGSDIYWDSTNKSLLLGADSESQANSVIQTSGNNNTLINKKNYGSDFIVYGSGTQNKNLFFSYDGKLGINIPSGSRPSTLFHVVNDICQSCSETVRIENRSSTYPTNLTLYYKPTAAIQNNSVISQIQLSAKNSVGNQKNYGRIDGRASDTTAGSEKGGIDLVLISGATGIKTLETSIDSTYVGYSGNRLSIQNNGNLSLINGVNQVTVNNQGITLSAATVTSTGTSLLNSISSQNITSTNIFINNLSSSGLLTISNGKIVNSPISFNSLGSFSLPIPANKLLSTTSNGAITGVYTLDDYFLTQQDITWSKFDPRSASVCLRQITFSGPVPLEEFNVGDQIVIKSNGVNIYRTIVSLELSGNQIAGLLVDQNVTQSEVSTVSLYSITRGGYLTLTKNTDAGVVADATENVLSIRPSVDTVFNNKQKDINFAVYGVDENPALLIKANSGRISKASGVYSPFASSRPDMFPIIVTASGSGISNYYSSANYNYDISTNLFSGILSDVGTNGMPSHYGTYDQNGNVAEWIEKPNVIESRDTNEFVAGGSYNTTNDTNIGPSGLKSIEPLPRISGYNYVGFRIAALQGLTDSGAIVHSTGLNISFATITDPQNTKDSTTTYIKNPEGSPTAYSPAPFNNLGVVNNFYRLSKYEITNDQYCQFLNAVATSKTVDRNLYDIRMSTSNLGGISRIDTGVYEYVVKPLMGSKPVIFVSYLNALKFINWLHNGASPTVNESTIDFILNNGSYNIQYIGGNSYNISKSSYRKYWLPDLNEWHKAAYYRPISSSELIGTSSVSIKRSEPYLVGSGIDNTTKEPKIVFANLSVSGWLYADHIMIGDGTIMSSLSELDFVQGGGGGSNTDTQTTPTTPTTIPNITLNPQWENPNTKSILGTLVSCIDCVFSGYPLRLDEDVLATCSDEELIAADNTPWWCDINNHGPGWFI